MLREVAAGDEEDLERPLEEGSRLAAQLPALHHHPAPACRPTHPSRRPGADRQRTSKQEPQEPAKEGKRSESAATSHPAGWSGWMYPKPQLPL